MGKYRRASSSVDTCLKVRPRSQRYPTLVRCAGCVIRCCALFALLLLKLSERRRAPHRERCGKAGCDPRREVWISCLGRQVTAGTSSIQAGDGRHFTERGAGGWGVTRAAQIMQGGGEMCIPAFIRQVTAGTSSIQVQEGGA